MLQVGGQWRFRCLLSSATEWWCGLEYKKRKDGRRASGPQTWSGLRRRPSFPLCMIICGTTIPSIARLTESPCYWLDGCGSPWTCSRRERNMPTPLRGSVAAGIGAARAKRSRAYSPTATAGSRAAPKKQENIYDMADSFLTAESQECLRLRVTRMMSALRAVEIFAMVATVML